MDAVDKKLLSEVGVQFALILLFILTCALYEPLGILMAYLIGLALFCWVVWSVYYKIKHRND